MRDVREWVLEQVQQAGFALGGIAPALPSAHGEAVRRWVAEGRHGSMGYLENNLDVRLDPGLLLEGARSVIVVGDVYGEQGKGPRGRGAEGTSERQSDEALQALPPLPPGEGRGEGERSGAIPPSEAYPKSHSAPQPLDPSAPSASGRIARYAWGDDYHKVMKKRLHQLADALAERFPGEQFRSAVDTAPTLEREHAARAGLGWQAKNTMLIHPRHGSYFLLGVIVTTVEIAEGARGKGPRGQGAEGPSERQSDEALQALPPIPGGEGVRPQDQEPNDSHHLAPRPLGPSVPAASAASATSHCANCTRCIDACPTDAIAAEGYAIDASRCVGYLTIEHRDVIDVGLHAGIGDWIAGCDICQEVCPYNVIGQRNPLPIFEAYDAKRRGFDEGLDLLEVLQWTAEQRQAVLQGSALKRIKLDMWRRNALIAIGNVLMDHDDALLRQAVEACLDDENELVRATAQQVCERLAAR